MNPLVFGDYPDIVKKNAGKRIPAFTRYESMQVKGSFDFIGVNHYATLYVVDNSSSLEFNGRDVMADMAIKIMSMNSLVTQIFFCLFLLFESSLDHRASKPYTSLIFLFSLPLKYLSPSH